MDLPAPTTAEAATNSSSEFDDITSQLRTLASRKWFWPVVVLAVLAALEIATFWGFFTGATAPQWDFFNHYNTEAAAWWRDGSLFHQPQWMPYAWGGYPALTNAQNSSWYLPVGLVAAFGPFTIHASAALAALHVGFGALGVYCLARSWKLNQLISLLGLVIWFYAAGPFSNAEHLDIARTYAWVPWVLLVVGTSWKWDRAWRWLVAVLVLWQAILSMYPGILVASVYCLAGYVIVSQLTHRPAFKAYLLPLAITGGCAAAMSLLRYLPLYLTRGSGSPSSSDSSEFGWRSLGSFLYPTGDPGLGNDISMRSFFLPAVVFALIPLLAWRTKLLRPVIALVGVAAVLGLPWWPWHDVVRKLPGFALSRFTMSDFKPYLLLGLTLAALLAADRIFGSGRLGRPAISRRNLQLMALATAFVLFVFGVVGVLGPFAGAWGTQFFLLAAAVVIAGTALVESSASRNVLGVLLIFVAAASGVNAALATTFTWKTDRVQSEIAYYGAPVEQYVKEGELNQVRDQNLAQRPARLAPEAPFNLGKQAFAWKWGKVFYTQEAAVLGYVNLKGTPTFELIINDIFADKNKQDAVDFWAAPGILIENDGTRLPASAAVDQCAATGRCGADVITTPIRYRTGDFTYQVNAGNAVTLAANEGFYDGWQIKLCPAAGSGAAGGDSCQPATARTGDGGQTVFDVPAGDWTVTMVYRLPGAGLSYLAFWAALGVILVCGAFAEFLRRRRPTGTTGTANGDEGPSEGLPAELARPTEAAEPAVPSHMTTLVKFALVGGLNSLLHAVIVLGLGELLPSWKGFVLIMIGWVVCIPIGYVTQARWVWHAPLNWTGLAKISVSQVPSATISTLLGALGGLLGYALIVQEGMALVAGAAISYVLQRFWVFAPVRQKSPAASSSAL